MLLAALLCLATFVAAAAGDYLETVYVQRVTEARAHPAARASVLMYGVSFIGWVLTIKVSLWLCLPEVAGLYFGTLWAMRARERRA